MIKLITAAALLTSTTVLLAMVPTHGGDRDFRAKLEGDQEVPAVSTDASGEIRIRFADDFSSATLRLDIRDAKRVTQAHFHCGEAGVNGPVVIFVAGFHDRGWDLDGRFLDNVTITDQNIVNTACGSTLREIADAMAEGRVYANVHTVVNPSGEIRGQMSEN